MGYCGYKCQYCPAHIATKNNDPAELARCSAEWERIFGFRLELEKLKCDGCYTEAGRKADPDCPVRSCCRGKAYLTCAECQEYPCAKLAERFVSRTEIESRLGGPLPADVYQKYVCPLENRERLDNLHQWHRKRGRKQGE